MKKRQNTVQKFSTFLRFLSSRKNLIYQWMREPELERNIKQKLKQHSECSAEVLAIYFLRTLQIQSKEKRNECVIQQEKNKQFVDTSFSIYKLGNNQYSSSTQNLKLERHLSSYLQESCYYAAQKIQKQFRSIQYKYSLEDLFQIGNLLASQPKKIFRSFKLEYQHSSLERYAKTAISRFIGNTIYAQDIEAKREKFSDYGLLRDLNNKELKEALASKGINTSQIDSYCLARQCFNAVCQPQNRYSSRRLESPSQEDLAQITFCYNQRHNQLNLSTALVNSEKIQEMLSTCIQAARDYRTKRVLNLEDNDIVSDSMPTPWDTVIQIEEQEQIESLVSQIFTTIPESGQIMLKLWRGLNLTQAEIASVLKDKYPELQKQYQVARHLGKYSRKFLKEFFQQCQQLNPESVRDDKDIELIQESLDEYLQLYCQRLIYKDLKQFDYQYHCQDDLICTGLIHKEKLGYERTSQLLETKQGFIQDFGKQLEENMNLPPESLKLFNQKIDSIVSEWLQSSAAN